MSIHTAKAVRVVGNKKLLTSSLRIGSFFRSLNSSEKQRGVQCKATANIITCQEERQTTKARKRNIRVNMNPEQIHAKPMYPSTDKLTKNFLHICHVFVLAFLMRSLMYSDDFI